MCWRNAFVNILSKTGLLGKDPWDRGKIVQVWLTFEITIMLLQTKKMEPIANGNVADSDLIALELVSTIFKKFLFVTKCLPFKNYKRCFLFHLKRSSFHFWDIQIFVFPLSPLFLPVSHCLRAWFKINLKVYDVINCLNKNLVTHFNWYLEKNKRYDIDTLVIDTVLNKEHFYGKNHTENVHQKLFPDSFFILVNNPKQPFYARNSFKSKIFWKGIIKNF